MVVSEGVEMAVVARAVAARVVVARAVEARAVAAAATAGREAVAWVVAARPVAELRRRSAGRSRSSQCQRRRETRDTIRAHHRTLRRSQTHIQGLVGRSSSCLHTGGQRRP